MDIQSTRLTLFCPKIRILSRILLAWICLRKISCISVVNILSIWVVNILAEVWIEVVLLFLHINVYYAHILYLDETCFILVVNIWPQIWGISVVNILLYTSLRLFRSTHRNSLIFRMSFAIWTIFEKEWPFSENWL